MGAWGLGPYDNDVAADWFIDVGASIADHIDAVFERHNAAEIRAAAWLLGQVAVSPYTYDGRRYEQHFLWCVRALERQIAEARADGYDDLAAAISDQLTHLYRVIEGEFAAPDLFEVIAGLRDPD